MLPGIRFIFVTVILSASVLIFGLGAAALLRVSHEEFAALPPWRASQPQFPPTPIETTAPTLAMLRIETPDIAKPDETEASQNLAPVPSDVESSAQDTPDKPNATAEVPPQAETPPAPAEINADVGGELDPSPVGLPAQSAIAAIPAPAIGKQENATTEATACDSKDSKATAPEAPADQSETAEAKPDKGEAADIKVAEIKAPEPSVTAVKPTEAKGRVVKARTAKARVVKPSKPAAKKITRSGIYAVAQRRRAAARARAIARARAAQIAQQRLAATNPFAALFGIPTQPAQLVQTQTPRQ